MRCCKLMCYISNWSGSHPLFKTLSHSQRTILCEQWDPQTSDTLFLCDSIRSFFFNRYTIPGGVCSPPRKLDLEIRDSWPKTFFEKKSSIGLKVMGKIRENRYLSLKNREKPLFLLFFAPQFSWFLKIGNFRAQNGASILNRIVLAKENRFCREIFFKRKIMIHASTPETFFTIFAFCRNLRSRVMTSQIVIMTKSVSDYTTFRKNWKSWTKIAREMIPTVLASLLYVVIRKNPK